MRSFSFFKYLRIAVPMYTAVYTQAVIHRIETLRLKKIKFRYLKEPLILCFSAQKIVIGKTLKHFGRFSSP